MDSIMPTVWPLRAAAAVTNRDADREGKATRPTLAPPVRERGPPTASG